MSALSEAADSLSAKVKRHETRERIKAEIESIQKKVARISNNLLHFDLEYAKTDAMDLSNKLDSIAQDAAFLGFYIEYGSRSKAEQRRIAVRKALGYTKP